MIALEGKSPFQQLTTLARQQELLIQLDRWLDLRAVQGFRDYRTLLAVIRDASFGAIQLRFSSPTDWQALAQQASDLLAVISDPELRDQFPKSAVSGRWGHKLISPTKYPLLETLLHQVERPLNPGGNNIRDAAYLVKAALLQYRSEDRSAQSSFVYSAALDAIRTICLPGSSDSILIEAIAPPESECNSLSDFIRCVESWTSRQGSITPQQHQKLRQILDLMRFLSSGALPTKRTPNSPTCHRAQRVSAPPAYQSGQLTNLISQLGITSGDLDAGIDALPAGMDELVVVRSRIENAGYAGGMLEQASGQNKASEEEEPRDLELFATEKRNSEELGEAGSDPNDRGSRLATAASLSRFWILRAERTLSTSPHVLQSFELRMLREAIQEGAHSAGAALACLSLVTGLDPTTLGSLKVGPTGDISDHGIYRKSVFLPDNAAFVPEGAESQFRKTVPELELPLPEMAREFLRLEDPGTRSSSSVAKRLRIAPDKAERTMVEFLKQIAGRRAHRLSAYQVTMALRNRLLIAKRDLALAYLLTGQKDELPPVLLYYRHIPLSELREAYVASVEWLLSR